MHRNRKCHLQHFNCYTKMGITIELSFLAIILHKKTMNWTSNRIIVKRKYIFEVETRPTPRNLSTDVIF